MGMTIVVTGASGFIGTALGAALSAAGREWKPVSVRSTVPSLEGAAAVVHLAAIAHARAGAQELERVNEALAAQVGEAAAAAGARMIFVSSVKVHGDESREPLTEMSPIAPGDRYGESKAKAEEALRRIRGLRLTVLRPPLVYGPGVRANFLALLRAVRRGVPLPLASIRNRRSLLFVGNLADAVLRAIAADAAAGRTYLLADGEAISTPELCRRMGTALGRPARLFPCSPWLLELAPGAKRLTRSLEVDDAAIRSELGWRAPYTLDEGLSATARWYAGR